MQASEVPRAVAAALSSASALDLMVDDAIVLHDSNRLVLRLLPCDVVARVANVVHQPGAAFEVALAQRLANTASRVSPNHRISRPERKVCMIMSMTPMKSSSRP